MAAINTQALVARADMLLSKRSNWASENVGVMVVFCIVGTVGIFLVSLMIYRCIKSRRVEKA